MSGAPRPITPLLPYADEIIAIPTRMMTEKDAAWAVAFAIPADTEGVKLVCRATSTPPRQQINALVEKYGSADSFTIFDNVFVPWERVFMCGEHQFAGQLASLFATYHRHSYTGCKPATTDVLMGTTALMAEYNGIAKASHIRDTLAEMVTVAELVYGAGIASAVKSQKAPSGTYVPDQVYTNVARYHAGINVYREHEILAEVAEGFRLPCRRKKTSSAKKQESYCTSTLCATRKPAPGLSAVQRSALLGPCRSDAGSRGSRRRLADYGADCHHGAVRHGEQKTNR